MKYQIDQSGKIEDTAKHTVIAYSNDEIGAVLLPASEKRKLQNMFRLVGKPQIFIYLVFAALISILISSKLKQTVNPIFIIDIEYPSHDKTIHSMIEIFTGNKLQVRWQPIGKSSKAHDIAYKVFKKKLKIAKVISADMVWRLVIKRAGGRLNLGLSPKNRRSAPATKISLTHKKQKSI